MEDRVLAEGPPNVAGVVGEAPLEIAIGLLFSAKLANACPRKPRLLDWLMLGSYVLLQEWDSPSVDKVVLGLEAAW